MIAVDFMRRTKQVSGLFARIVPTYDLVNRMMSLGQDRSWRNLVAALALPSPGESALDVATGTGDLALALARRAKRVVGIDACSAMMAPAQAKVKRAGFDGRVRLVLADALALPYGEERFDCVTVAFGIRNMVDPVLAFREMRRVVKRGGRVVCLEIMPPGQGFFGLCYRLYLTRLIPFMGGWVSGEPESYQYLADSVVAFSTAQQLKEQMEEAGFSTVTYSQLNFETIAIHVGIRQ